MGRDGEVWAVGPRKPGVSPQARAADLEVFAKPLEKTYST